MTRTGSFGSPIPIYHAGGATRAAPATPTDTEAPSGEETMLDDHKHRDQTAGEAEPPLPPLRLTKETLQDLTPEAAEQEGVKGAVVRLCTYIPRGC